MKKYIIDKNSCNDLAKKISGNLYSPYSSNFEKFLFEASSGIDLLPNALKNEIFKMRVQRYHKGVLLVRGLPVDRSLINTPYSYEDILLKRTFISESIVACIGLLLGNLFTYDEDSHNSVIRTVSPQKVISGDKANYFGAQNLQSHTDMACLPLRPDFILLYCLRSRSEDRIATSLSTLSDVLPFLDKSVISELMKKHFRLGLPESLRVNSSKNMYWSEPTSILRYLEDYPEIRLNTIFIKTATSKAKEAISAILRVINEKKTEVALKKGDLLILDNRKVIHGRDAYKAYFDGKDRWLHQLFVQQSLWLYRNTLSDDFTVKIDKLLQ